MKNNNETMYLFDESNNKISNNETHIDDVKNDKLISCDCVLKIENLNDHFKAELLKEMFYKLELEEIQKLLNWEQGKGIDYETLKKKLKNK